jgi:hypothetical protein
LADFATDTAVRRDADDPGLAHATLSEEVARARAPGALSPEA